MAWIAQTDPTMHRAHLLKKALRHVFELDGALAKEALDRWLSWARHARLPSFLKVVRRVVKHRRRIEATPEHRLTNGLIESTNTKIRLLTRLAFGFHNPPGTHRPGRALPRRHLPAAARPNHLQVTHGWVRRAQYARHV
jgi:transposase